jgi:hypothetical protein
MKPILICSLAFAAITFIANCNAMERYDRRHRGTTTTTTMEETTLSTPQSTIPLSTTVETRTTRSN